MSKSVTLKKGLAVGLSLALAWTGITGIAANAAGTVDDSRVTLVPSTGIDYAVMYDDDFDLTSSLSTAIGYPGSLKWLVDASSATELSVTTFTPNAVVGNDAGSNNVGLQITSADALRVTLNHEAKFKFNDGDAVTVAGLNSVGINFTLNSEDIWTCQYDGNDDGNGLDDSDYEWVRQGTGGASSNYAMNLNLNETSTPVSGASAGVISYTATPGGGLNFDRSAEPVGETADAECENGSDLVNTLVRVDLATRTYTSAVTRDFTATLVTGSPDSDRVYAVTGSTTAVVVDSRLSGVQVNQATLNINPDNTGSKSFDVTAWIDSNDNSVIDSGEFTSTTRTIDFLEPGDVALATDGFTFVEPVLGDESLSATIKTSPAINDLQSSWWPAAEFTWIANNDVVTERDDWGIDTWTYSNTTGAYTSVSTEIVDVLPGYYTATPYMVDLSAGTPSYGNPNPANDTAVQMGVTVAKTINAGFASFMAVQVPGTNDVEALSYLSGTYPLNGGVDAVTDVRLGTASATGRVLTLDLNGNPVANSSVQLSGWGTGYTVNGAASPVTLTTDANGVATFTVAKVNPAVAGQVDITVATTLRGYPEGYYYSVIGFNWTVADYDLYNLKDNDPIDIEDQYSIQPSASEQLTLALLDQWGITAPSTYRIRVQSSGDTTSPRDTVITPSQSGTAYSATSDGDTGVDVFTLQIDGEKPGTFGGWSNVDTENVSFDVLNISNKVVLYACDNSSGPVGAPYEIPQFSSWDSECVADTYVDSTLVSYDSRTQNIIAPNGATPLLSENIVIQGRIVDSATGLARPYASVTLSANGLAFTDEIAGSAIGAQENVVRKDTITVRTNGTGRFIVWGYSNTAAYDVPVTITSGSSTATHKVTFLPVDTTTGVKVDWTKTPVSSVKAGRTANLSFKIVDDFGNNLLLGTVGSNMGNGYYGAGLVTVRYTGPGLLMNGNAWNNGISAANIENGVVDLRVLTGPADFGKGTVTVTYYNYGSDMVNRALMVKSHTFWIGPIVDAKAGAKKGRVVVDAYHAKGRTVSVFVGKTKVGSFVPKKSEVSRTFKTGKSGDRKVTVKISGPGKDFSKRVTLN